MSRAWWSGTVADLRAVGTETIVAHLALRLVETHRLNREEQLRAWRAQVPLLVAALAALPAGWTVLLEYPLLRLGRRIDTVILTDRAILVLEFKAGAQGFAMDGRMQVDDYALDLRDFHAGSRAHPIVPILVAPRGPPALLAWPLLWHAVVPVLEASAATLPGLLAEVTARVPVPAGPLDAAGWDAAPYRPVPTIVEAARMLYARHGVADLAAARADATNLTRTTAAILAAIATARGEGRHIALFVTGIPGAGKTLCGLNVVFAAEDGAAFLTGNLPLVHVMRAALARDARAQGRGPRQPQRETASAIQPVNGFLRDNRARADPPHEHVILFDEAQRAWDADFGRRKFDHDGSEAALILDIMARHRDWAVVVALVGGGQEINTGEAGLAEWGTALAARPAWRALAAPGVIGAADPRQRLVDAPAPWLGIDPVLHLDVPVRSIRSAATAPWVEAVLAGRTGEAQAIAAAEAVPVRITRSLDDLRAALRRRMRGLRRAGLVCSAGARRLVADGLWPAFPHLDADAVAHWFLDRWPDVRASDALELPATQFACQGLELDYVGLAWGGDLIRRAGQWTPRRFVGTAWQTTREETRRAYAINTYRVLLTRARYETLIFIPPGAAADATRAPAEFDAIADYLTACGAAPLELAADPVPAGADRLL